MHSIKSEPLDIKLESTDFYPEPQEFVALPDIEAETDINEVPPSVISPMLISPMLPFSVELSDTYHEPHEFVEMPKVEVTPVTPPPTNPPPPQSCNVFSSSNRSIIQNISDTRNKIVQQNIQLSLPNYPCVVYEHNYAGKYPGPCAFVVMPNVEVVAVNNQIPKLSIPPVVPFSVSSQNCSTNTTSLSTNLNNTPNVTRNTKNLNLSHKKSLLLPSNHPRARGELSVEGQTHRESLGSRSILKTNMQLLPQLPQTDRQSLPQLPQTDRQSLPQTNRQFLPQLTQTNRQLLPQLPQTNRQFLPQLLQTNRQLLPQLLQTNRQLLPQTLEGSVASKLVQTSNRGDCKSLLKERIGTKNTVQLTVASQNRNSPDDAKKALRLLEVMDAERYNKYLNTQKKNTDAPNSILHKVIAPSEAKSGTVRVMVVPHSHDSAEDVQKALQLLEVMDSERCKKKRLLEQKKACPLCKEQFVISALDKHILSHHVRYPCDNCGITFLDKISLERHMVRQHHKSEIDTTSAAQCHCEICGLACVTLGALKHHKQLHRENHGYPCHDCGQAYLYKNTLLSHQIKIHGKTPYICSVCGKVLKSKDLLEAHEERHLNIKSYSCEFCNKSFYSKVLCNSHSFHHHERAIKCNLCDENFTNRKKYYRHRAQVHIPPRERKHKCEICGHLAVTSKNLMSHMRVHTKEKPFECDFCQRTFSIKSGLPMHINRHLKIKPAKCKTCGKRFRNNGSLHVHERIHTGEKPHKCRVCEQSFNQINPLKRHLRLHNAKYHLCVECGEDFDVKADLRTHLKEVHKLPCDVQPDTTNIPLQTEETLNYQAGRNNLIKSEPVDNIYETDNEVDVIKPERVDIKCELTETYPEAHEFVAVPHVEVAAVTNQIPPPVIRPPLPVSSVHSYNLYSAIAASFDSDTNLPDIRNINLSLLSYPCAECGIKFKDKAHCDSHIIKCHSIPNMRRQLLPQLSLTPDGCEASSLKLFFRERLETENAAQVRDVSLNGENPEDVEKALRLLESLDSKRSKKTLKAQRIKTNTPKSKVTKPKSTDEKSCSVKSDPVTKLYKCNDCSSCFKYKSRLKAHNIRVHGATSPYICSFCGKVCTELQNLRSHERTHTGERPFECPLCQQRFSQLSNLGAHTEKYHPQFPERKFECVVCQKMLKNKNCLKRHLWLHRPTTDPKPYICDICGRRFSVKHALKIHTKCHSNELEFYCNLCTSVLSSKPAIEAHILKHFNIRPYKCKTCKKKFFNNSLLKAHQRTHSGEKPFVCRICQHRFNQRSILYRHMRSHGNAPMYACEICGEGARTKVELDKHNRISHSSS